ncbi:MAG: type II secretion system F family protein [Candidatus Nanoarchaeia archaeon]
MTFAESIVKNKPLLKKKLLVAKISQSVEDYVSKILKSSIIVGFATTLFLFFILSKDGITIVAPLLLGIVMGLIWFQIGLKKVDVMISKRAKRIDKEVLFAGRFLLIKLNSGKPLINAIEEAAKGFGDATEYFKDIMRELELGTPLETALERATEYCPSKHLKKILFQITNALKIGVDVTNFLEAILDEIAEEELTEIMKYGKKLSSLTMFYMLGAIIVPSLGMTLFVVVASLVNVDLNMLIFSLIVFGLFCIQFLFITLFRSARPNMDI